MNEREIFQSAIEITDDNQRQAYLIEACGTDIALRENVERLLRAHVAASGFLQTPAAEQLASNTDDAADLTAVLPKSAADAPHNRFEHGDDAVTLEFLEPSAKPDSLGRIAHYEVLEVLGRGAFGIVLKAFDEKLHRMVAIKVMNPELAATSPPRKRFLREAQSSAKVRHEHIVAIYAVEEQPVPYLVMEYIPGGTLQQRLDAHGPLELSEILRLGQQIALGLAAAHAQGLIHRDIKPANILLESGIEQRAKITDFGLARATDDASLTQSGLIAGTPMFMAPEQAKGQPLDHRADLFSLGSVLYTMASGRPPFRAPNTIAVLKRLCEDTPRPIPEIIPETPQWLCNIISKLHEKDPGDRYQSATEVAQVLGEGLAHLSDPVRAPEPVATVTVSLAPSTQQTPRKVKREPKSRTSTMLLALIAGLFLVPVLGCFVIILGLAIPAYQRAGTQTTISLRETGTLIVQSDEPFITAIVDDQRIPLPGREEVELQLPAGSHQVTFLRDGVRRHSQTVDVQAGNTHVVRLTKSLPTVLYDAVAEGAPWQPLFNGRDLDGWMTHPQQPGNWRVEDGAIVGSGPVSHLFTARDDLVDFELRGEVRLNEGGNSGVFLRTPLAFADSQPPTCPAGYELQLAEGRHLDPRQQYLSGGLIPIANPVSSNQIHARKWYKFRVLANGDHLETWIDNVKTVSATDPQTARYRGGHLALQVWTDQTHVEFRNLEVRNFPQTPSKSGLLTSWQSLFNGRDLTGWRNNPDEAPHWTVENGMLVSRLPKGAAKTSSFLLTERSDYRDFHVRIEAKINEGGDSGFFFRFGEQGVASLQAQITAAPTGIGALLRHADTIVPSTAQVKPDTWFTLEVIVQGPQIVVLVDGQEIIRWNDPNEIQGGPLALESGFPGTELWIRKVEVGPVSTNSTMPPVDFTGIWDSGWGPVTVKHGKASGNQRFELSGDYFNGKGRIRGTVDPSTRTFRGTFHEPNGNGRLQMILSADGTTIDGGFDYLSDSLEQVPPRQPWRMTRQNPESATAPFSAEQAREHQDAWAKYLGVPVEYTNSIGMKFRLIPPGEFLMGSTPDEVQTSIKSIQQVAPSDVDWQKYVQSESPQHKVLLSQPYYLGKYEVTQQDYETVMGTNPSRFAKTGPIAELAKKVAELDTARFAVENISWNDAAEFCARLSQREQLKPVSFRAENTVTKLDGNGYRLPTEAQWEFACRAGTTTRFSSGDGGDRDLIPSGWFWSNAGQRMHAVGELKPNPFGLFDMHGNAAEFVEDVWGPGYYEQFAVDSAIDPAGVALGEGERINRIIRGGFWQSGALGCRSGSRFANDQLGMSEHVGFRVALPVDAVKQALLQSRAKPAETLHPLPTVDLQAARASVVEKELFRDQVQQRHDAGTASALELIDTEIDLSEALAHLNRLEGKVMGVLAALTNLVSFREREHALVAEQVKAGVVPQDDLLRADASLRDATGRLDMALASTPAVAPFDAVQAKTFQEAWAKHLGVPVEYTNPLGMKFRLIPPGTFLMGATEEEVRQLSRDLEQANASDFDKFVARFAGPQHWVKLTQPYYLAAHEVTVGQYREFIESSRHIPTMDQLGVKRFKWQDGAIEPNRDQRAVIGVSWDDALAFCRWASKQHAMKYDLPTEAQWEYACRAGTTTMWSFGDDVAQLPDYAVFGRESFWPAEVVGTKKPNPFGLWDMHGNADEWCLDWHDSEFYKTSPPNDPASLANPKDKNSGRVARGGTAHSTPWWTRSVTRPWDFPATPNNPKGFRPVLTVDSVKAVAATPVATIPQPEWQPLFNGRDLAGWKSHPEEPGNWRVEEGILVSSGAPSYLFSERDDFTDFHLRAEVQVNAGGDGGIMLRCPFMKPGQEGLPGYEGQIQAGQPLVEGWVSGAIGGSFDKVGWRLLASAGPRPRSNERFLFEIVAKGNVIETRINGEKVGQYIDPERHFNRGHIALQQSGKDTLVQFHKIEVAPLSTR